MKEIASNGVVYGLSNDNLLIDVRDKLHIYKYLRKNII